MNEDNGQTGQQGYGSDQDPTRPQDGQSPGAQQNAQPLGGNDSESGTGTTMSSGSSTGEAGAAASGQASYGNSGQADADPAHGQQGQQQSQNSPSLGQESDIGQSGSNSPSGGSANANQGAGGSAGSGGTGTNDQDRPLGTAGGGYGASAQTPSAQQGANQSNDATGQTQADSVFAEQGQGALAEDTMGSGDTSGITDIETERSQGRESDIEGSAL